MREKRDNREGMIETFSIVGGVSDKILWSFEDSFLQSIHHSLLR
jgi:hypothetical protein